MAKKKRHLSRAHRAKISRGLKAFHRQARRRTAQRKAAAKKAATTRALKRQQQEIQRGSRKIRRAEAAPPPRVEPVEEEWEVTIKYQKAGSLVSVSVVVFAPNPMPNSGKPPTKDEILGAVWRAANGHALTIMEIRGVDWRKESRTGRVSENSGTEIDLQSFKQMMFKSVLRAELVGD